MPSHSISTFSTRFKDLSIIPYPSFALVGPLNTSECVDLKSNKGSAQLLKMAKSDLTGAYYKAYSKLKTEITVSLADTNVFNKGTSHGLKVSIPNGGQIPPISIAGDVLEWKNAQKKAKKNIISDTIKSAIPHRKPI